MGRFTVEAAGASCVPQVPSSGCGLQGRTEEPCSVPGLGRACRGEECGATETEPPQCLRDDWGLCPKGREKG